MHCKWVGQAQPTAEVARAAQPVGADAVALGDPDERKTLELLAAVRQAVPGLPLMLAGYTTHDNAARLLAAADGACVGTCLERGGWGGPIEVERVKA
jgi:hypothetical protein